MKKLSESVGEGGCDDVELMSLIAELQKQLSEYNGKKVYGYLPKSIKDIVDKIVQQLAENPVIAEMYENWCKLEREKSATYTGNEISIPPLWEQDAFKPIRNMVVKMAGEIEVAEDIAEEEKPCDESRTEAVGSSVVGDESSNTNNGFTGVGKDTELDGVEAEAADTASERSRTASATPYTTGMDSPRSYHDIVVGRNVKRCAMSLLRALSKMLAEDFTQRQKNDRRAVDSKLKSEIRRKKQAMGIKEDHTVEIELKY